MLNLPPPPGFQGLRDDVALEFYQGTLPHWRQSGATYFVTFRLGDSLPTERLRALRALKKRWEATHPPPRSQKDLEDFAREAMSRLERWLDQGMGTCLLKLRDVASLVANALHELDGSSHELGCYVVMPNHVHLIVRPLMPKEVPLESLLKQWKGSSAREINLLRDTKGSLWQPESFDRIVRDEEHLYRAIQYIASNPAKAGILPCDALRWIRPEWAQLGWRFEDGA